MLAFAATVLLMRDGPRGLEVFMVERHREIDFAGGALVFPGGRLDDADGDPELLAHCAGAKGLGADAVALRLCGIRETFEEAGILLARDRETATPIGGSRIAELRRRYRTALHDGEITLQDIVFNEGLVLACDEMTLFAHWVTPRIRPKRFDTMFYLAAAPADQLASHDEIENVDSLWITPRQAVADADAGLRTLVFVTRFNLLKLAESDNVAAAMAAARRSKIVTVEPTIEEKDGRQLFQIPENAGYAATEYIAPSASSPEASS